MHLFSRKMLLGRILPDTPILSLLKPLRYVYALSLTTMVFGPACSAPGVYVWKHLDALNGSMNSQTPPPWRLLG